MYQKCTVFGPSLDFIRVLWPLNAGSGIFGLKTISKWTEKSGNDTKKSLKASKVKMLVFGFKCPEMMMLVLTHNIAIIQFIKKAFLKSRSRAPGSLKCKMGNVTL